MTELNSVEVQDVNGGAIVIVGTICLGAFALVTAISKL